MMALELADIYFKDGRVIGETRAGCTGGIEDLARVIAVLFQR
jgi:hypothetical protein